MKPAARRSLIAACLACAGCASQPEGGGIRVLVQDNVAGASQARVEARASAIRVSVLEAAGGCRLQRFVISRLQPLGQVGPPTQAPLVRTPDQLQGGSALLDIYWPGDWIVRAEYVHTVAADGGQQDEPVGDSKVWGEGDLQVGRALQGGYRYQSVQFASRVSGPGGASAQITRYPTTHGTDTRMVIHWYYDAYSKVSFRWTTFAQGPCDASP